MNDDNSIILFRAQGSGLRRDSVADSLRGFAIILVVIGHVLGGFQHSRLIFPGVFAIYDFIYSFHMPLFFMIAGYVQGMKDHFSGGQKLSGYFRKYFVDLYLPCLYFSLMYWLLKYFLISPSNNAEGVTLTSTLELYLIPLKGFQEYWFICTLFFLKVIHLSLEHFSERIDINLLFWCVVFVAAKFFGAGFLDSTARLSYGLYFHAGFLIKRRELITEDKHPAGLYGVLLFVAGFMFFLLPYVRNAANAFTATAAAFLMSIALMVIFYAFGVKNAALGYCGVFSMVIYALHNYIIAFMRFAYRFAGLSSAVDPAVLFVGCVITSILLPILVIRLYKNVKCLRWVEYIFYPGKLRVRRRGEELSRQGAHAGR